MSACQASDWPSKARPGGYPWRASDRTQIGSRLAGQASVGALREADDTNLFETRWPI